MISIPVLLILAQVLTGMFLRQVEAFTRDLEISNDALEKVMGSLLVELNNGLMKSSNPTADIKQYITYVRDVPDGSGKLQSTLITSGTLQKKDFHY